MTKHYTEDGRQSITIKKSDMIMALETLQANEILIYDDMIVGDEYSFSVDEDDYGLAMLLLLIKKVV